VFCHHCYCRAIKLRVVSSERKRRTDDPHADVLVIQPEPISVVILENNPKVKKSVTKWYHDGHTLSLLIVDEKLQEKSLTYRWEWDYDLLLRQQKEKKRLLASSIGSKEVLRSA
jgi:hypothetical protein